MAGVAAVAGYGVGTLKLSTCGGGGSGHKLVNFQKNAVAAAARSNSAEKDDGLIVRQNARFCRRDVVLSATVFSVPLFQVLFQEPAAALLEADDDEELLEKAKGDRQKRLEKRGSLSALKDEAASVQDAVYKMSKAGQAIEKADFASAGTILGTALDADWVIKAKSAFAKVSVNAEQNVEADIFTASLASLQSAVSRKDANRAKSAFVASATALEKWTSLTGLAEKIKGL